MSKPRVLWSAPSATVTYEASLKGKDGKVRKALLTGDWYFGAPTTTKTTAKRNRKRLQPRKRPRKPSDR